MNLVPYIRRLSAAVAAKDKNAIEDVCFELECTQLECDFWAQDVFDVFANALQDGETCSVKGSSNLVLTLYNDFEKLTRQQVEDLLIIFDKSAEYYGDEMLRHSIGDMVARKYPTQITMEFFKKWLGGDSSERRHMGRVGFEVLIMTARLDSNSEKVVRALLSS